MRTGGHVFGIIVTSVGIGLLLIVFWLAFQMLSHPVPGLSSALATTSTASGASANVLSGVGGSIIQFLLKIGVLFVMTFAGSHISARGVQLYHGVHYASTGLNGSVKSKESTSELSSS